MEPDVTKQLEALTKRVAELEKKERQSKQAMSKLSVNLNKLHKLIRTIKSKLYTTEGNVSAIRNSLRKM